MKLSYFRLLARPFPTTPDPQFYYAATPHENALDRLQRAIDDGEGLALLIGEPGTGKTLVAHLLLDRLGPEVNTALITNCRFSSRSDMLRAILFDLVQPYEGMAEQELRLALTGYLLDQLGQGKKTVLVFDEAQDLTRDLLQELRLLGNVEAGHAKAVQIVLLSLPSILAILADPELAGLSQRLAVRVHLEPLGLHESGDYLVHQVRKAGGRAERVMTDEAISVLARAACGVPRLLNRYAYLALALAEQVQADRVDAEVALEAMAELGVEPEPADEEFPSRPTLAAGLGTDADEEPARSRVPPAPLAPTPPSLVKRPPANGSEAPWIAGAYGAPAASQSTQAALGDE